MLIRLVFKFIIARMIEILILVKTRGDQILNAASFEKKGYSLVLPQEKLTKETLLTALETVRCHRGKYVAAMEKSPGQNGTGAVLEAIEKAMSTS